MQLKEKIAGIALYMLLKEAKVTKKGYKNRLRIFLFDVMARPKYFGRLLSFAFISFLTLLLINMFNPI